MKKWNIPRTSVILILCISLSIFTPTRASTQSGNTQYKQTCSVLLTNLGLTKPLLIRNEINEVKDVLKSNEMLQHLSKQHRSLLLDMTLSCIKILYNSKTHPEEFISANDSIGQESESNQHQLDSQHKINLQFQGITNVVASRISDVISLHEKTNKDRCRMFEMCRKQYPDELCQQSKNGIKCTKWKKAPSVHLEIMNNHTPISNKNGKLNALKHSKKKQKYPSKTEATTNKQVLSDTNRPINNTNISKPNETKIIHTEKNGTVQAGNAQRQHLYDLMKRVMLKLTNQTDNETVLVVNPILNSFQKNLAQNIPPDANETQIVMEPNPFPTATPNSHLLSVNEEYQKASQPHQQFVQFIINAVVTPNASNSSKLTVETKKATTVTSSVMARMSNVVTGPSDDSQGSSQISDESQVIQTDAINVSSPKMFMRREISEQDADCITTPCRNDGKCINENGVTSCICSELYEGKFCEDMVNPCKSNPCLNGGTCTSIGTDYICQCQTNFEGLDCENDLRPCSCKPCENHGSCFNINSTDYRCICTPEYAGPQCELRNPCLGNACLNNTQCNPSRDGLAYTCTALLHADKSTLHRKPCELNSCNNGGSCVNINDTHFRCNCRPEFLGKKCELKNPCLSGVCPIGNTCSPSDDGINYTCISEALPQEDAGAKKRSMILAVSISIVMVMLLLGVLATIFILRSRKARNKLQVNYSKVEDFNDAENSDNTK